MIALFFRLGHIFSSNLTASLIKAAFFGTVLFILIPKFLGSMSFEIGPSFGLCLIPSANIRVKCSKCQDNEMFVTWNLHCVCFLTCSIFNLIFYHQFVISVRTASLMATSICALTTTNIWWGFEFMPIGHQSDLRNRDWVNAEGSSESDPTSSAAAPTSS